MKHTASKMAIASALVLTGAFAAQTAGAVEITSWDYTVDSAFSAFTGTGGDGVITPSGSGLNSEATTLSWGTNPNGTKSDPQSSISITGQVTPPPTLVTNDGTVPGATFSHNNRVIPAGSNTLKTFDLSTRLTLTPLTPPSSDSEVLPTLTFGSKFAETFNEPGGSGDCSFDSTSACDDIFVLTDTTAGVDPLNIQQSFTLDDYLYTVFLNIEDLVTLDSATCTAAGASDGCVGLTTQEGLNNQFLTNFRIESVKLAVPEPGTLALLGLGLGLVGFGFVARRRNPLA